MKAHRNIWSHFGSQALLALCCIALLAPRPAEAQNKTDIDAYGRALHAAPGAPILDIAAIRVAKDVLKQDGCDMDDCSQFVVRESPDQFLGNARTRGQQSNAAKREESLRAEITPTLTIR